MDILSPLFVQVGLTFILIFGTAFTRVRSIKSGAVHPKEIALREPNWTKLPTKFANAFHNQLETPLLFYLLVVLLLVTNKTTETLVYLAWGYVILRVIHAMIHITYNNVLHRFMAFAATIGILLVMWLQFALGFYA
jgi:hypothetical protein